MQVAMIEKVLSIATTSSNPPVKLVSAGVNLRAWIVSGPAGSGKSSLCKRLAKTVGGSYIEGDDVCPFPYAVLKEAY